MSCEINKTPALSPALMTPATQALDAEGQHSATSAMPLGHIPPTPKPTRNRSRSICSCVLAHAPRNAKTE